MCTFRLVHEPPYCGRRFVGLTPKVKVAPRTGCDSTRQKGDGYEQQQGDSYSTASLHQLVFLAFCLTTAV